MVFLPLQSIFQVSLRNLSVNLLYLLICRILNAVQGQRVYESEEEFLFNQKMYDELQDIMELVGFTQEVYSNHRKN